MKTLKITVLAIFAIALLTGVSQLKEETVTNESSNKEINVPKVKLTLNGHIKGSKDLPSNG